MWENASSICPLVGRNVSFNKKVKVQLERCGKDKPVEGLVRKAWSPRQDSRTARLWIYQNMGLLI